MAPVLLHVAAREQVAPDAWLATRHAAARKIPRTHRAIPRLQVDIDKRELRAQQSVAQRAVRKGR